MGQYCGRKRSMMLVAPVTILAFICQALAPSKEVLFFGRFLAGLSGGLVDIL
jgi:MFS family permease